MSTTSASGPIEQPTLSEAERVVDTFIAPSKTFTDLRRNSNWLVPWLLMIVVGTAMVFLVDRKLGMEKIAENGMALQPKAAARFDQLPPDQRARQMQVIVKITRISAYAFPVIALVFLVIFAAILWATFNFGLGSEIKFNQSLAVCVFASLPSIVKVLLTILTVSIGGGDNFTFQNPVASNLSPLIDPSSHFLYSVATNLDIFMIWTLVLAGIGYSCLTNLKRGLCLGVVFGWWVIWVLGTSGLGAAFS
jgi:hypothetical protein